MKKLENILFIVMMAIFAAFFAAILLHAKNLVLASGLSLFCIVTIQVSIKLFDGQTLKN